MLSLGRSRLLNTSQCVVFSLILIVCVGFADSADEGAPSLRYAWKPESVFAYEVSITADRPDATDQLQGVITYTVKNGFIMTLGAGG